MSDTNKKSVNLESANRVTSGSIFRTVISLAMPVTLGMFMEFALSTTDYYWVGKLGASAQDAITSSMVVIWTMFASISIISVGITAIVARYVGAKDFEKVVYFIRQGMGMAVGLGLIVSLLGYLATPYLLAFMGASPDTFAKAVPYLRIFFMSATLFFVAETTYAIFRSSGDTKTPTKVGAMVVLLNLALDPILIFGWGPIPAMGVPGASLATAIAIAFGALIIVTKVYRGRLGYEVGKLHRVKPDLRSMGKIAKIGLPMASQQFVFVAVYWFLIRIVHQFGETAGAAMGIGNRMESFSYLTCYGISLAASTMVGQNLGAGQPDRAAKCVWGAMGVAVSLALAMSVLFITIPRTIAGVFTNDPEVMRMAIDYLVILGLSQVTMAVEIVLEGSFGGAGDTMPPMIVQIPGSIMRIPMAYYLCFTLDWGLSGVWWTLTITTTLKAMVLAWWFHRGRWKLKQI